MSPFLSLFFFIKIVFVNPNQIDISVCGVGSVQGFLRQCNIYSRSSVSALNVDNYSSEKKYGSKSSMSERNIPACGTLIFEYIIATT